MDTDSHGGAGGEGELSGDRGVRLTVLPTARL